jgi:Carboxylesterase family
VMAGMTADEFISPVAGNFMRSSWRFSHSFDSFILEILNNSSLTETLNNNFDEVAPKCFFFESTKSNQDIGKTLRDAYFPMKIIDIRSFSNLNHLFADGVIGFGVHKFVHLVSPFTDVFYYKFSYVGRYSLFKYPGDKPYGVHHADDIQYLFASHYIGSTIQLGDQENLLVERMTRIWEQFAISG